jgi:hypothetical protein
MSNARIQPPRKPLDARGARSSPRPRSDRPSSAARLDEALADAAKMARRVERVLEDDPFAAALLAREYLSRVQELEVNPLEQQGRTDAWTSAFVRLRVVANRLQRHEQSAEGEAYIFARAEERRLRALFGDALAPRARLTAARAEARRKRLHGRVLRIAAVVSVAAGIVVPGLALFFGHAWLAAVGAGAGALLAVAGVVASTLSARSFAAATRRAVELERGIAALSLFETGEQGRTMLQRIQREHPLLLRTTMGEGSSAPPPPPSASGAHRRPT